MKRGNLQLMADHLKINVNQENFHMGKYRGKDDFSNPECGSVGCAVGNCTVLDVENVMNNFTDYDGEIEFMDWSEDFTGLLGVEYEYEWYWCFDSTWSKTDNTPTGAALRIEWLLNNGLPENWKNQMYGHEKLCYM